MVAAPLESDPQGFSQFAQRFYSGAASDDLKTFSQDGLAALARMFWRAVQERRLGAPFIRVFDPTPEKDGFTTTASFLATINDDKPFLVDSVLAEIADRGLAVKAIFHPIMRVKRDASGGFRGFVYDAGDSDGVPESMICIAFSRGESSDQLADIHAGVARVLADVDAAVVDWKADADAARPIDRRALAKPAAGAARRDRGIPRLPEMAQGKSLYVLGRARLRLRESQRQRPVAPAHRHRARHLACSRAAHRCGGPGPRRADAEVRGFLMQPSPLIITKSIERSTVHRRVQEDYIGIKRFNSAGALVGERRFVGLFTSAAYKRKPARDTVPAAQGRQRHGARALPRSGHSAKALAQVLETFPRDELFQISDEDLLRIAPGIAYLTDRPRTKVFLRFDTFNRFASALVYLPADKFRGGLMRTLGSIFDRGLGRAHCGGLSAHRGRASSPASTT